MQGPRDGVRVDGAIAVRDVGVEDELVLQRQLDRPLLDAVPPTRHLRCLVAVLCLRFSRDTETLDPLRTRKVNELIFYQPPVIILREVPDQPDIERRVDDLERPPRVPAVFVGVQRVVDAGTLSGWAGLNAGRSVSRQVFDRGSQHRPEVDVGGEFKAAIALRLEQERASVAGGHIEDRPRFLLLCFHAHGSRCLRQPLPACGLHNRGTCRPGQREDRLRQTGIGLCAAWHVSCGLRSHALCPFGRTVPVERLALRPPEACYLRGSTFAQPPPTRRR